MFYFPIYIKLSDRSEIKPVSSPSAESQLQMFAQHMNHTVHLEVETF